MQTEYDDMVKVAKELKTLTAEYTNTNWQIYVAAFLISAIQKHSVCIIPPGGGKSYICLKLALYYHNQGKKTAIVTSKKYLKTQLMFMMGDLRQMIDVKTMTEVILCSKDYDQLIIDEADDCILNYGSVFDTERKVLNGFWDVLETPSILITATMDRNIEDIMHRMFGISSR